MENLPSVYVIILNWNHLDDLKLTIDSFLIQDYPNLRIIVADNGSNDGSVEYINHNYEKIKLIENKENLGYAAGNNKAIKWTLEQEADYILLANNDIFIDNKTLISLIVKDFKELVKIGCGIYGIEERNCYDKNQIVSQGHILFEDFQTKDKIFNQYRINHNTDFLGGHKKVDFVSGSFILINCTVFNKCGLLDENFFMYHEEAEFCYRAWLNGYYVVVNPNYHYFHKIAQSSGTGSPFSLYYRARNNFYFLMKHKGHIQHYSFYFRHYAFSIYYSFLKLTITLFYQSKRKSTYWKALYWAIVDSRNKHFNRRF